MRLEVKENSKNYACSVVEIKNLFPIEGADNVLRTVVNGNNVVVPKTTEVGSRMLYFVSGTKLSAEYCRVNNLYDKEENNLDTTKRGFVSFKSRRIKCLRLRGVISDGMLMPLSSLLPFLEQSLINYLKVGDEFTDIELNGRVYNICEKYIVPIRNSGENNKKGKQSVKISRLVDSQFYLHGDTSNLRKNMDKINPNDIIGIHYKKHGTSFVVGNVQVKRFLSWFEKLVKRFGVKVEETMYDIVYSSRKIIKNGYLNPTSGEGFYGEDIWGVVAKEIEHLIPKNWTLYGEILGYTESGSAIQGKYDYGCKVGEHKVYIYKISVVNTDGNVIFLTDRQIEEYCEKVGLLYKDTFIYYGTIRNYMDMYFIEGDNWREEVLKTLEKNYNEKDCYMCTTKVPEEGCVIRIEGNDFEAYKAKSNRFYEKETKQLDKGETNIEDEN